MTARTDLVERDEELLRLAQLTAGSLRSAGAVGLVIGPVASGKSELLRVLCEDAGQAGVTALRAVGSQAEQRTPLSIVGQLLQQAPFAAARHQEVQRLVEHGVRIARQTAVTAAPGQEPWPLPTDLVGALCATVFELAEGQPLLICVDDVHHADPFSLQWLLFLIRRLGTARITVVLAERTSWQHPQPAFHAELLRQPNCHRIQLGPLTHHGVVQLLQSRLDAPSAAELAGSFDALTGGNPLLAHALLEDLRTCTRLPSEQRPASLGAGYAFCRAVVSCLHRSEAAALAVARGIAIFADNATAHLLAQLLDLSPDSVEGVVEGLESAGLLDKGQFRHPAVRDAVLRDVPASDLSALRHGAAHLLYTQGAPQRDIAELLLASEEAGEPWSTGLLCDVAREALFEGDAALARRCVEHAYRACADRRQRGQVLTLMVGVEWQLQPGNATRLLPMLTAALQAGDLSDRHSVMVVKYLLRHGRITDASTILDKILVRDTPTEARTTAELRTIKLQLSSSYPGALAELPPFGPSHADEERAPAAVRADPQLQAAAVLDEVLSGRAEENTYLGAEQVLRSTRLSYRSFEQVEFALLALIYGDQEARAAACCEQLLDRVRDTAAQGWRPPLLALRSLIAVRQGHLAAAEKFAATALEEMPWQGWGVTVGLPLASLLMARTAMGKYEEAAELLNRPVPQAIYKTRYGLHYLHARGEYRLATNNPHAALEDFLICGEMMQDWDLDLPSVVPWRGAAAKVHLHTGKNQQAKALVDEQLKRLNPGPSRTRGTTLRLSAATSDLKHGLALLRQAVDELQRCEAPVELALALADLGYAHQSLGDHKRSRIMMNRAWQLAKEHGAEPIQRGLSSMFPDYRDQTVTTDTTPGFTNGLSSAERRVASLAALGHTNREIARDLFITVSTVEQHLTRVYRKLNVTRRSDLPGAVPGDDRQRQYPQPRHEQVASALRCAER